MYKAPIAGYGRCILQTHGGMILAQIPNEGPYFADVELVESLDLFFAIWRIVSKMWGIYLADSFRLSNSLDYIKLQHENWPLSSLGDMLIGFKLFKICYSCQLFSRNNNNF